MSIDKGMGGRSVLANKDHIYGNAAMVARTLAKSKMKNSFLFTPALSNRFITIALTAEDKTVYYMQQILIGFTLLRRPAADSGL